MAGVACWPELARLLRLTIAVEGDRLGVHAPRLARPVTGAGRRDEGADP